MGKANQKKNLLQKAMVVLFSMVLSISLFNVNLNVVEAKEIGQKN